VLGFFLVGGGGGWFNVGKGGGGGSGFVPVGVAVGCWRLRVQESRSLITYAIGEL
jgi:hypothetical protein